MSSQECSQPPDLDLLDLDIEFDPGTDDDVPTRRYFVPPAITTGKAADAHLRLVFDTSKRRLVAEPHR